MAGTFSGAAKKRLCVMASGGGSNFQSVIDAVRDGSVNASIELLIYDRKDAGARLRAEKAGIPSVYINRKACGSKEAFDRANLAALGGAKIDIVVLAGYLAILGEELIAAYENRIINVHPSLIPSFCGMGFYGEHVHQAAIDYGVKISGCTVHFVTAEADAGPVILQESVPVFQDDNAAALAARVLEKEHKLLPEALALLCAGKLRLDGRKVIVLN